MNNNSKFKPAWWLPGPHLQTLWPTLCRRDIKNIKLIRERFELSDGDFVDLDWTEQKTGRPIVLILHGLEGSVSSPYAKGMLLAIQQRGWQGVFMHFRSCSDEMNLHPRTYHSGDTTDVASIVEMLQRREKCQQVAAVGFSLGGNVLLKWLGELGQESPLAAAVGISVPFILSKTADRIQQGFSRVYEKHFMKSLRRKIRKKFAARPSPIQLSALDELRTLREFDDRVTAPLHGFQGANHYYEESSCRQYLKHITTPTLLLQSKDDPFMTQDIFPEPAELSPSVKLELTERGGHVGFVTGKFPWRAEYWLEQRVPEFLKLHLK